MSSRTNTTNSQANKYPESNTEIHDTSLAIDIGSLFIRSVVVKNNKIIKKYKIASEGVENGLIVDPSAFEEKITTLINKVAKDFTPFPESVIIGIGSINQESVPVNISVFTKRSDGTITEQDMDYAKDEARKRLNISKNKAILHSTITKVCIDDDMLVSNPVGMSGYKLDIKMLFILDSVKMQNEIVAIFNKLKININDIVSSPLAESLLSLSKKDKRIGAASVNIGLHNTSIVVYLDGSPILAKVIRGGGESITSDMALGMRISYDEAERVKVGDSLSDHSKRRAEEIIESRLDLISERINDELKLIKVDGLLPSGVFIMGGTSNLKKIDSQLRQSLKLPITYVANNISEEVFDIDSLEYLRVFAVSLLLDSGEAQSKSVIKVKKIFDTLKSKIKKYLP